MREQVRELTPLTIILGVLIGCVMGAANAYVGLKFSLTISASIPAAVISMGIMRGVLRRGSLLENNMVQTIGSAGESLAAGVIFTVPALFILAPQYPDADLEPDYLRIVIFALLGGVLGILMMIPLRRYLIVKQHNSLPYPEGTACAEVLKSGQSGGSGAVLVFGGLIIGFLHKMLQALFKLWEEGIVVPVKSKLAAMDMKTEVAMESSAVLLGVGYILGIRVSAIMVSGGLIAWLVIIPMIAYFGANLSEPFAPAKMLISDMNPSQIWTNYIRYVGAGGVVFGGLISLLRAFPAITASVWHAVAQLFSGRSQANDRTDRDLPIWIVIGGSILIILGVYLINIDNQAGWSVAIATAVAGFVFVAVASRIVGLVGSTSSPVSGMTIATLMATAVIFRAMGMSGPEVIGALIGVGAVVCIAIAMAGDCSQDLKTGYLVGATPGKQQIGELIGVVTSAITCAGVLLLLNDQYGFVPDTNLAEGGEPRETLLAAQANVISLVVKGIMEQSLPWELIFIGAACAFVAECLAVPSLPFAVGLYLPLSVTSPIFGGGLLHWLVAGRKKDEKATHAGILGSSGLVAGGALMGLGMAALSYFELQKQQFWIDFMKKLNETPYVQDVMQWWKPAEGTAPEWRGWVVSFVPFLLLMLWLAFISWRNRARPGQSPPPDSGGDNRPPVSMPPSADRPTGPPATPEPDDQGGRIVTGGPIPLSGSPEPTAAPPAIQPPPSEPPAPLSPTPQPAPPGTAPVPDPAAPKVPKPSPGPLAPREDWFASSPAAPEAQQPPAAPLASDYGTPPQQSLADDVRQESSIPPESIAMGRDPAGPSSLPPTTISSRPPGDQPVRPDESMYIIGTSHEESPTPDAGSEQPPGEGSTDTLGLLDELGPPPEGPSDDETREWDGDDNPKPPSFGI